MKRLLTAVLLTLSSSVFAATLNPIQLLNPAGSTAGQAIVSTGASGAPAWGGVGLNGIAAIAANTVLANATASNAAPTAFAMPNCSTSSNALSWTTSTGFTCNTSINASSLGGTAAASYAMLASPAFTGTPTAPAPATSTNNTQIATTSFGYNLLASGLAPAKFTTLQATSLAKVFATNTSAQSIGSGANVAVTGWTTGFDANSNFTTSTGTFTAPMTGYYVVSAQLMWGAMAGAGAAGALKATVYVNGSATNLQGWAPMSDATQQTNVVTVSGVVSVSAGQTIVLNAFQNSGSAVALSNAAGAVWMSIYQLP